MKRMALIAVVLCVLLLGTVAATGAVSAAKPANRPVRVEKYPLFPKVSGLGSGSITIDLVSGRYTWEAKVAHPNVWYYVALSVRDATGWHETLVGVGGAYATPGGTVHKNGVLTDGLQAIKNAKASGPYGHGGTWAFVLNEQA